MELLGIVHWNRRKGYHSSLELGRSRANCWKMKEIACVPKVQSSEKNQLTCIPYLKQPFRRKQLSSSWIGGCEKINDEIRTIEVPYQNFQSSSSLNKSIDTRQSSKMETEEAIDLTTLPKCLMITATKRPQLARKKTKIQTSGEKPNKNGCGAAVSCCPSKHLASCQR